MSYFVGHKKNRRKFSTSSGSSTTTISTDHIGNILDNLKCNTIRESTKKVYLSIWGTMNNFLVRLNRKPTAWEDRIVLFGAYLVEQGAQSSTVRSYFSALKKMLSFADQQVDEKRIVLGSLVCACKLKNDCIKTRLPLSSDLLEIILFEWERFYNKQRYLEVLYKAMFLLGFYGLLRIGEMTASPHVVKAANVHIGLNKNKILVVLYSSKTHHEGSRPQKIKILANESDYKGRKKFFCPFREVRSYLKLRGNYFNKSEQFFVFSDHAPVKAENLRRVLRLMLSRINLDPTLYDVQSLRIGRASEMIKQGCSVELVQRMGRWKSNAVYKYIRN